VRETPPDSSEVTPVIAAIERLLSLVPRPRAALRPHRGPDPIDALVLLDRLGRVSYELTSLSSAHWAPRARFNALTCAYDGLLLDVCSLADVTIPEHASIALTKPLGEAQRTRLEVELLERGWMW
jgi:hypothetical protein